MKLDNDTLKHCIFSLLTGLEIQDVDLFMERLSPANCLKLGRAYAQASRGKVVNMAQEDIIHKMLEILSK